MLEFCIELEINEPAKVGSEEELLRLHAAQIKWISVRLNNGGESSTGLTCSVTNDRSSLLDLIAFARRSQPEGTSVKIWFRGRSEEFSL